MADAPAKPPITAHVLNTVTGLPAAALPVTLTLVKPYGPSAPLTATTNADGRVLAWDAPASGPSLQQLFDNARSHILGQGPPTPSADETVMVWALRFDVGRYFAGQGFWDEVEIRFKTDVREGMSAEGSSADDGGDGGDGGDRSQGRSHWHVPLLLSPWSYTTYRGS